MTLKTAVVAPMPRASESREVKVKPDAFASKRKAYRVSCHRFVKVALLRGPQNFIIRIWTIRFKTRIDGIFIYGTKFRNGVMVRCTHLAKPLRLRPGYASS